MRLKQFIFALVAMLSSFAFTANAQTAVSSFDELKAALANSTDIVVNGDIAVDEAITIPSGTTVAGDGTLRVQTKVYVVSTENPYPGVTYNKTATKNGSINGTVSCDVVYEISLDGGENWFTDTTNGKAQAVTVKKDGTKTISTSFQSAFTSAKCGEVVHMLKDAHVQSTNSKKNNGPLRSYYGLILEGNGHTIYTDVESSGASNEYATIKFTSYLAGTGPDVRPVLKNVTIDSQKNAKADLDIVSGDVTFTVSLFNVNLLGKCVYASFPVTSLSLVLNKSNVKLFDSSIPSWDAGSATAIEFYSGNYSLNFNSKCKVYGGTFSKDATKYLADRAEMSTVNGKYVVTCKEEKVEAAVEVKPSEEFTENATEEEVAVADELATNTAVTDNNVELPADVATFTVQLTDVEVTAESTTEVVFTVTPSNILGEKISTPSKAITFRLPVPAAWSGKANVYHEGTLLGEYTINDENGAKYVEVESQSFSTYTVQAIVPVAKIGETTYATLAEAVTAAQNGETITLIDNVVLAEKVTIPADKTLTIDLNGKSISMEESIIATAYAINNLGNLTITDGVGGGSINARGVFNGYGDGGENVASAAITVLGGTFNAKGTDGGAAIFNYGTANVNGGTFTSIGGYSLNNQAGASMTIADGVTANNGIYASNATLVVNGGEINGNRSGCHVLYAWNSTVTINGGTFYNYNSGNSTIMAAGTTKLTIKDGTFGIKDGRVPGDGNTWTSCLTDTQNSAEMTVNGGTFNGGFRVQAGTSMTINGGSFNDVYGSNYNIYGTVTVTGGTFTDATAKTFASKHIAAGYELNADGTVVAKPVAEVNGVKYASFAEAAAAAQAGDEIKLLANIEGDITVPAGVILNGGDGFAISGGILAAGEITFAGVTTAASFNVENTNTVVNIPAGASLQLTGAGRMVIGHGCTFNITGSIADNAAKTTDKASLTPSLVMQGASFTGAGVTFNVANAYISAPSSYCSSSKTASGTFDFNIANSIWECAGKLAFESQSTAATVNFDLVNSVLNTGSHLIFGVSRGEVVIDNSNVNVGKSNQIENQSTMTIKNGSVVNGAVATSSNAKNPGTLIVENATYAVTGDFSGSDLGTGTLIIKKGAKVSAGSITKANIQIDATDMVAGNEVNLTANLSNLAGTLEVINNDKLEAKIVDGKIVLVAKPVAKIAETPYTTLEAAFAAAQAGVTIELLADVATEGVTLAKNVTINGNGYKITPANVENTYNSAFMVGDSGWGDDHGETITINNVVFEGWKTNYGVVRAQGVTLNMNGCEFNGNSVSNVAYAVLSLNYTDATVKNSKFVGNDDRAIDVNYNADGSEAVVTVDGCTFDGNSTDGAGIIYKNAGDVKVLNSTFVNNTVSTNGNAATVYTGWGDGDEVVGCTFEDNTVTTTHATTKRFASAIFCDGCVVSENVFGEGNTATRNGESISTIVAVGAYYGAANISANYWGAAPEKGIQYTIEYTRNEVALNSYYKDAAKTELYTYPVAKIGEQGYATLQAAFDAVKDGETITLIDNVTVSVATAAYNDGTYIDGVRYTGDKSFTVDFNGKTVTDDGCVNDYLIYINNKGEKASKITFTNGTIVSANGCWSAVCVNSPAATQNVELNLNGMNITNSNDAVYSGNPVVRVRTLATVNVNDGTIITSDGASYGVAANTDGSTVNINEGATIVQQNSGTTGGNSVFAAVGGKGVINIKGGTITSDRYGVHTMTTGTPVINISGGTITAPVALKSSTNGGNGELATINVTGGTINGTLETYTDNGKIVVSGGTFSEAVAEEYCAEGFVPAQNADGTYGVVEVPSEITVADNAQLQAALDNCAPGTTINLSAGVEYGVVYMRPSAANRATKVIDWLGNNYVYETYTCYEGLTINGAEGATIDAIVIEGNTYYNSAHSQAGTYPVMLSLIELKNVVIDGVTFTGEGGYDPQHYGNAINVSGNNIKVNGLTIKNCVLSNSENNARLLYKTESTTHVHTYTYGGETYTFTPDLKDITITGCTFNGGYMGLELRETENLIISGNTFNGVTSRDMLLPANDGCTYTGVLTITNNISDGAGNRFVRASGVGAAALTIKDNVIVNYKGGDDDFIKVDGITSQTVVVENNTFDGEAVDYVLENGVLKLNSPVQPVAKIGSTPYATLEAAVEAANAVTDSQVTITLLADIDYSGDDITANVVLDLNGKTVTSTGGYFFWLDAGKLTVKDSSDEKTGKLYGVTTGNAILVYGNSTLVVEDVEIFSNNNVITTGGTNNTVVVNGGKLEANSATQNSAALYLVGSESTVTINAGTIIGNIPFNYGTLVVNGGSFTKDVSGYCAAGYATVLNEETGMYEIVAVTAENAAAKIGDRYFLTLNAALQAATDESEIVVLKDFEGNLESLKGTIVPAEGKTVAVNATNTGWYYLGSDFTIGEGVTFNMPNAEFFVYYTDEAVIKGKVTVKGLYMRYAGTRLTVEAPGALNVTGDTFIIRYVDGDGEAGLYIVGDDNDETVELTAPVVYFYQGMINAKDANINVGTYWQTNDTDGEGSANLVLDNSVLNVTVPDHAAKATGNSTVTLKNGALLNTKNSFIGNAAITVDAAGITANTTVISGNVEGLTGEITLTGNDVATYAKTAEGLVVVIPKVAAIGEAYYATLQAAIDAAQADETVVVLENIELNTHVVVAADKKLTLDLNGKTVSYTSAVVGEDMITNNGNLTIDSSVEGGKITYKNTDTTGQNVTISTISACPGSTLVVNGGTIENTSVGVSSNVNVAYTIDILTNGSLGDVAVTIGGGSVVSTNYIAIRQFNNGTACENSLTINGGYIYGAKRAVQVHLNNNAAVTAINGGKVEAGEGGYAICNFAATSDLAVTGGELIGAVYSASEGFITGGTFSEEPYSGYLADHYVAELGDKGYYGIKVEENYIFELEIIDGEYGNYTYDSDKTVGKLTYKRTLPAAGIWYPVFLPFDVPVDSLDAELFNVARINDLHTNFSEEDGSIEKMWVEYIVRKSGTLPAGKPFLVKAKSSDVLEMVIVLEDVTLYPASKKSTITVASAITEVTFEGVYESLGAPVSTPSTRYMAVNANGVWDEFDGYSLNPFRVMMTLNILDEEYYISSAASLSVGARVIGEENEDGTTTIYDVEVDRENDGAIYDLQGRRVLEPQKGGLYIVNGKKIIF